MNDRMKYFLAQAVKEVAYTRKPKWGKSELWAWINNSVKAYEKDPEFATVLRALELSCTESPQQDASLNRVQVCDVCGEPVENYRGGAHYCTRQVS